MKALKKYLEPWEKSTSKNPQSQEGEQKRNGRHSSQNQTSKNHIPTMGKGKRGRCPLKAQKEEEEF
jgi:hypothetical protein